MRNKYKVCVILLFVISIVLNKGYMPTVAADDDSRTVTILFTHDLHSNLLPLKTEQNSAVVKVGGFARLQTAINREKDIDRNAILVDAGDYSMGTPFQAIFQSASPELRLMGIMGYDAVTLGNHEFDYRASGLAESLNAAKNSGDKLPQIVLSNYSYPKDKEGNKTLSLQNLKQAMDYYGVKDYTVIERDGVRIGIFGLVGDEAASMAPMSEIVFEDRIANAKRVVEILKQQENVDLIVCLSHSGIWNNKSVSEDEEVARKVPGIDIIISGHTHTKLYEPVLVGNTIIGSGEANGKNLGVIKVKQQGNGWKLEEYRLVPIDNRLQEDPDIVERVEYFKNIVQEKYFDNFDLYFDQVVAHSPINFPKVKGHKESFLGNLISDAFVYAVKRAEGDEYIPITAAIVPAGTIRGTIYQGEVTVEDAFSISSLGIGADNMSGYPLISVYLTGKELKTVTEVDASIAPMMEEAQLFISGVNYTFNPNRLIFNKVTKVSLINPDGTFEEIDDKKLYRVVAGLYSAQMLSIVGDKSYGLMSIVPKTKEGVPITDYEAEIIYNISDGNMSEVKEWKALVDYLQSFDQVNGVSQIPLYYTQEQGRKVIDSSRNIIALVSNPNRIAITVYAIVTIVLALILFTVIKLVKRLRKKKTHKNKS